MGFLSKLFAKGARDSQTAKTSLRHTHSDIGPKRNVLLSVANESDDEDGMEIRAPVDQPARQGFMDDEPCSSFSSRGRRQAARPLSSTRVRRSHSEGISALLADSRTSSIAPSASDEGIGEGDELSQSYRCLKTRHRGSNCIIQTGLERGTLKPVVVKVFKKTGMSGADEERRQRELDLLEAAAAVPYVMRLIKTLEDDSHFYTVVEGSSGVTLIELMANCGGRISEQRCIREVAIPLLQAVAGLHALGISHRHLKPEHIVCHVRALTLVDFTDAIDMKQGSVNSRVGELQYMAPEVLSKPRAEDIFHEVLEKGMAEEDLPQYDEKADIWSIGVILLEALTGQQPFLAEDVAEMMQVQAKKLAMHTPEGMPEFVVRHNLPAGATDLLSSCLREDPGARPSAKQLLSHPWLARWLAASKSLPRVTVPNLSQFSCPVVGSLPVER